MFCWRCSNADQHGRLMEARPGAGDALEGRGGATIDWELGGQVSGCGYVRSLRRGRRLGLIRWVPYACGPEVRPGALAQSGR